MSWCPNKNEKEIREMYEDDPFVSPYWYGKMIEEAQERDIIENAERLWEN